MLQDSLGTLGATRMVPVELNGTTVEGGLLLGPLLLLVVVPSVCLVSLKDHRNDGPTALPPDGGAIGGSDSLET